MKHSRGLSTCYHSIVVLEPHIHKLGPLRASSDNARVQVSIAIISKAPSIRLWAPRATLWLAGQCSGGGRKRLAVQLGVWHLIFWPSGLSLSMVSRVRAVLQTHTWQYATVVRLSTFQWCFSD